MLMSLQNGTGIKTLAHLLLGILLGSAFTINAQPSENTYSDSQFFVYLEDSISSDTLLALLTDLNATEVWSDDDYEDLALWQVNGFPFSTEDSVVITNIAEAILRAQKKTKIRDATFDFNNQSLNLQTANNGYEYFADSIFNMVAGTNPVKISILDTGISDLSDNSDSNFNFNLTQYSGWDYVKNDSFPNDEHGHGSHIAGIIYHTIHKSTVTHNQISFDIRKTHDSEGQSFMSDLVIALADAIDENADIVNMSFSFREYYDDSIFFPLKVMMQYAAEEDILMIVAAGNNGEYNGQTGITTLPASFPLDHIITVASLSSDNTLSTFSNYGKHSVDIGIRGEEIPGPDLGTGIVFASGTSQATALISTAAAILGTYQNDFDPTLTKCALIEGTRHRTDLADKFRSNGIIDLVRSIDLIQHGCSSYNNCNTTFSGLQMLHGTTISSSMIETNMVIESSAIITSDIHLTYDSGSYTELFPGFEVAQGTNFQILGTGCDN